MRERVHVTREQLEQRIVTGEIDTVLMVFPDLQGRLVGKRTTASFFLDQVADEGTENCDYLIATDIDDNPLPGYRFASYEQGYGDMLARADWSTVRVVPWVAGTAMIICDLFDVASGEPIEVAPRRILQRQVEAAGALGYLPMVASEIEFHLYRDTYEEAHAKGYRGLEPHSPWIQDYHVLQTTKDEYLIGQIRRGLDAAGVPVEFSKGEAGRGQHEINLSYATPVEMADRNAVFKNSAKEIAALNGRSITFMAKVGFGETGSSCHIHSSLWDLAGESACFASHDQDDRHGMNDLFRQWTAGQLATAREFALLWAPTVNSYRRFLPDSWAPTGIAWGVDNRTLGFRVVGHGSGARIESRVPGADANTYLAFAGTIAAGLHGIRQQLELPDPYVGNGYTAADLERIPTSLPEAIDAWEASETARECFGDDVHQHIANTARQEWLAFNRTVTDWELVRYFERI
jgi:glutamine synthetase